MALYDVMPDMGWSSWVFQSTMLFLALNFKIIEEVLLIKNMTAHVLSTMFSLAVLYYIFVQSHVPTCEPSNLTHSLNIVV